MKNVFSFAVLTPACAPSLFACDLCAVYSATQARGEIGKGFSAGVAEQFTHFGTMQDGGVKVPDDVGQWLDSSVSQLFVGYNFSERFGVQFNAPLIQRSFKRPDGFAIDRGTESGLGDVSLVGHFNAVRWEKMRQTFSWTILGGVKLPTGSAHRLQEELTEVEIPGAPESGIHGHDLTLGSGSVDGIVGTGILRAAIAASSAPTRSMPSARRGALSTATPTTSLGPAGREFFSCSARGAHWRCNSSSPARRSRATRFKAREPKIPASRRSISDPRSTSLGRTN